MRFNRRSQRDKVTAKWLTWGPNQGSDSNSFSCYLEKILDNSFQSWILALSFLKTSHKISTFCEPDYIWWVLGAFGGFLLVLFFLLVCFWEPARLGLSLEKSLSFLEITLHTLPFSSQLRKDLPMAEYQNPAIYVREMKCYCSPFAVAVLHNKHRHNGEFCRNSLGIPAQR